MIMAGIRVLLAVGWLDVVGPSNWVCLLAAVAQFNPTCVFLVQRIPSEQGQNRSWLMAMRILGRCCSEYPRM